MDNKDKQALIDGTATIPYKLHILNDDGSIKDTLTEEDIVSTDYEDYRYVDSSSLCIGQFVARKLKGEIKTIDKDLQIEDKEISVEMGVNRNDGSKVYDITIDGKSEQETRSGKNLLKNTNVNSGDNNYWSSYSTFNESTNTLTRSTTATTESFISHRLNGIKSGTQYTLSLEAKSNGYVKHMDLYCYNSSLSGIKSKLLIPLTTDYQKITWTFTTDSSIDYSTNSMIRIDNNGSTTSGTEAILTVRNVMLVEGTDTDFEPYGASPSPDYPQEIKSVEGIRNLFKITDDTSPNIYVSYEKLTDTSFRISATRDTAKTWSGYVEVPINIKDVKPNTTYTFSKTHTIDGTAFNRAGAIRTKINGTYQKIQNTNSLTFTTPETLTSLSLVFYIAYDDTKIGNSTVTFENIQLEEGSIPHDYVPYGSWLQVKDTGKNLLKLIDGTYTSNGVTAVVENGIITLNGTATATSFITINNVFNYTFKANQKYTISFNNKTLISDTNARFRFSKNYGFDVVKDFYFNNINSSQTFYFTKDTEVEWIQIRTGVNITYDNFIIFPQLEKGSTATEYEPYKETSTLIDMNKPNLFDKYLDTIEIGNSWNNSKNTKRATIVIPYEGNKPYTIKCSKMEGYQYVSIIETADRTSFYYTTNDTQPFSRTVVSNANTKYICLQLTTTNDFTIDMLDNLELKIYEGYTDYYELPSIGDTKDELNIDKDGNVSITQNIGEVVLNGSESWSSSGALSTEGYYRYTLANMGTLVSADKIVAISDYFVGITYNQRNSNVLNTIYGNGNIGINTNVATRTTDFKTWLSTHPVTVKYILDKPQTISLGKYDKIENIDDTENITIQTNIDTTFTKISYNLINWYNLGNFLITKPTDDDVKDTLTFDSMDYTKKFNKSFDPSGITFPCTALQLAKYCCEECGVELATNEFLNYNFEVIDNQYTNEDTFRNVMQDIGKLAYSWVRIGWDNKCYIDFNYGEEVDEYNKIDNDNYYDLDLQQKQFGPVNRIVIGMSNVEGENVYIEDEKSIVEHGVTELQIYDNNLTYTPELRNKVIDSAKVLFGLTYTPMTLNTTGHPWLLGKEKVEVTGMNNTIYYTYPWDRTISYSGHIKSKLESKCDTKTEIEYKYKGDVETVLKKTRIIVNKQENTITSLTQQTETIQDNLNKNYYDRTQTNELIQTSSTGITNTFSEAGGNNVFRNTGLWFSDQKENTWEYWTGIAKKTTNDKAVLGTSILLQSGTFSQEQEVPNGNYSISFYYRLSNPLAKATVTINENTYELTSTDYKQFYTGEQDENKQYITFPIEVTATHLNISFKTDINNSVEVYDLMANKGSVKLAYSQNENEITTDTVNISKGITITSSVNDTKFKANADGIRIVDKNNDDKITEFTDKGMTTKEAIIKEEATIVQVLIQNIGDQTWFTRL